MEDIVFPVVRREGFVFNGWYDLENNDYYTVDDKELFVFRKDITV